MDPCLSNAGKVPVSVKTVRGKLLALEYFCQFVLKEVLPHSSASSCNLSSKLSELHAVLPAWRQSLRVKCSLEEVRRRVQDSEEQISPQHIQNYLCSDYAKHAERMLLSGQILESVSNYDFTRCRNHILVLLCVGNAHRTGVLTHFSVADYEAGIKAASESEHVVFTVAEHKTASTHGAATVAVNRKEVSLLTVYMKLRLLPQFAAAAPFVFITAIHTKMTLSNVSNSGIFKQWIY